jgi:hypothetical protein
VRIRLLVAAAILAAARPCSAAPDEEPPELPVDVELPDSPHPRVQWTLTMDVGGGLATREVAPRELEGIFHMAGHSLLLFGRKKANYWGAGLSMDAGTWDFGSFVGGAGLAVLAPIGSYTPLVMEAWPHYLYEGGEHSGGVTVRMWWGIHTRNYINSHVTVVGLYAQASRSFGARDSERWVVILGLDFSMIIPLLPVTALASLIFK